MQPGRARAPAAFLPAKPQPPTCHACAKHCLNLRRIQLVGQAQQARDAAQLICHVGGRHIAQLVAAAQEERGVKEGGVLKRGLNHRLLLGTMNKARGGSCASLVPRQLGRDHDPRAPQAPPMAANPHPTSSPAAVHPRPLRMPLPGWLLLRRSANRQRSTRDCRPSTCAAWLALGASWERGACLQA